MHSVNYSGGKIPVIQKTSENIEFCITGDLPKTPQIAIIRNFLSKKQCEFVIDTAIKHGMKNATIQNPDNLSSYVKRDFRNAIFSQPGNNKFPFLSEKIKEYTGWESNDLEDFSVIKYPTNGFVKPHNDWISKLERTRVATFVTYLQSPKRGGQTIFPLLKKMYKLNAGDSIFFNYVPNKTIDDLHGSNKVLEGEKWIVTSWLQEI